MLATLLVLVLALCLYAAVGDAYKYKSSSYKATSLTGVLDAQENDTAESIEKHRADTSLVTEAVFIDGVGVQIVITTTDLSIRNTWELGAVGILIVVKMKRANGTGAAGGGDKTDTYANAVLVAKAAGAPFQGRGTLVLTFEATDPAGAAVVVHS